MHATNVVPSSPILVTLIMEAPSSSETSVPTKTTPHNIPEDAVLHDVRTSMETTARPLTRIASLFYMKMMFVLHWKHTPSRSFTGRALGFSYFFYVTLPQSLSIRIPFKSLFFTLPSLLAYSSVTRLCIAPHVSFLSVLQTDGSGRLYPLYALLCCGGSVGALTGYEVWFTTGPRGVSRLHDVQTGSTDHPVP
jgi:hypothetical protein